MRKVNIAFIGIGTVGGGAINIVRKHHDDFMRHHGVDLNIVAVHCRTFQKAVDLGVDDIYVETADEIINNPDIEIVVELVGGTTAAKKFVLGALRAGKHVVTANKALMATSGEELFDAAHQHGVSIMFGGSVGGGIPIIGPLKHSLGANEITTIMGIVNGTTNYMLTKMGEEGLDYSEVLKEAQRKGFAEANPSADVEGEDAAAKIAILASIAFNCRVQLDDVHTEGITRISPVDLEYAKEMGYAIKLLAIANRSDLGIEVRVHPAMVPMSHQLASVNGVFNAIYLVGDAVGECMFFGEGAGAGPTGSAVIADVIEIAKLLAAGVDSFEGCTCTDRLPIVSLSSLNAQYYIRVPVLDRAGVFAEMAKIFAREDISIKSVVQRGGDGRTTDLVVITHEANEKAVQAAISDMMLTETIVSEPQLIRLVG